MSKKNGKKGTTDTTWLAVVTFFLDDGSQREFYHTFTKEVSCLKWRDKLSYKLKKNEKLIFDAKIKGFTFDYQSEY